MEKVEELIKNNYRRLVVLWVFFTLILIYYFAVARTIQTEGMSRQDQMESKITTSQPWNVNVDSLATRKAKMGFYETYDCPEYAYMKGWAFYEKSKDCVHDSVYLILELSPSQRWIAQISRFGTPDVVDYYRRPDLSQAGFEISVEKQNLKDGSYHAGLLFRNKERLLNSLYWLDYSITVQTPSEPVLITRPSGKLEPLTISIYKVEEKPETMLIDSWAFPKTGVCTTCEAYIILSSPTASYQIKALTIPRPDVVDYFKNTSLLMSGREALFIKKDLVGVSYRVGIMLKDTLNHTNYFSQTDNLIHVGLGEFATIKELDQVPNGPDSIRVFVDTINDQPDFVEIKGFAFLTGVTTDSTETSLLLKSAHDLYSLSTIPVLRSDIQGYFKLSYNLDLAGFKTKVAKETLEQGEYQLCIIILNKKNNLRSVICLDKMITI